MTEQTKHTPTPWNTCHKGKCQCKQIWSIPADIPIAVIESGKWGDKYPTLKLVGGTLDTKAVAVMDIIDYGEIPEEIAVANAEFIVRACNSHDKLIEALESLVRGIDVGIGKKPLNLLVHEAKRLLQIELGRKPIRGNERPLAEAKGE